MEVNKVGTEYTMDEPTKIDMETRCQNQTNAREVQNQTMQEKLKSMLIGRTYMDILLRNHIENVNEGLEELMSLYEKLFQYGMFLSGFQFVGLIVGPPYNRLREFQGVLAYFSLSLGFFSSIFAVLVAFMSLKFFKSMKNEDPELVFTGCLRYKKFFLLADVALFASTGLFLTSLNLQLYFFLDKGLVNALNVVTGVLVLFLVGCHFCIFNRQQSFSSSTGKTLKRKLYADKGQ
eukprot:gene18659-20540_t